MATFERIFRSPKGRSMLTVIRRSDDRFIVVKWDADASCPVLAAVFLRCGLGERSEPAIPTIVSAFPRTAAVAYARQQANACES